MPDRGGRRVKLRRMGAPLLLWMLVIALLWAHKKHGELSQKTYLKFAASLNSARTWDAKAAIDGIELQPDGKVSIGPHIVTISHAKAEALTRKIFVWYGENDLGEITLTRKTGAVTIRANPPAPTITIKGPEFSASYKNISETNITIPTDRYRVAAHYRRWEKEEGLAVVQNAANLVTFAPPFGALRIGANYPEVSFTLSHENGAMSERGTLPYQESFLPEGRYRLLAVHGNSQREVSLEVQAGKTTDSQVEFIYGAAFLKTSPPGATVTGRNDQILGKTPLLLTELEPGDWTFVLRSDGYEPVSAGVKVSAYSTNEFEARLVNENYSEAIRAAREHISAGDFNRAYEAANAALKVAKDDKLALELKRQASGLENVRLARMFAGEGDFGSALKRLDLALSELPERSEIKALRETYTAEERKRWLSRGERAFEALLSQYDGANLFEKYRLTTRKSVYDVQQDVLKLFATGDPVYSVTSLGISVPESFSLKASYTMPLLSTKSGRRDVIVIGTQRQTNETEILFKILEYKPDVSKSGSEWGKITYVPIHPSRIGQVPARLQNQLSEGISDVGTRIKRAIE